VESALLADPDAEVVIQLFGERPDAAPELAALARHPRVRVADLDVARVFDGLEAPAHRYLDLLEAIPARAHSARSNLLRYAVLHREGGVYLDLDVLVLRSFGDLLGHAAFIGQELVWVADEARVEGRLEPWMIVPTVAYGLNFVIQRLDAALGGRERVPWLTRPLEALWSGPNLNNAVIGCEPGSEYLKHLLAAALAADPRVRYHLGPTLVSRVARAHPDTVTVLPPAVLYAERPSYSFRYFACRPYPLPAEARLVHYVSSNHGRLLAGLDRETIRRRRDEAIFYQVAADVMDRAGI
jgi:hypothetical protein